MTHFKYCCPVSDQIIAQPVLINQKSLTVVSKEKFLDAVTEQPIKAKIDIIINGALGEIIYFIKFK